MRGHSHFRVALLFAAMVLAGCTESASVPTQPMGLPSFSTTYTDTGTVQFTVTPDGGNYSFGKNKLIIPAKSICDPATTLYAETEWDKPCTVATAPITFTVRYGKANGRPYAHITPDVRFVPTTESNKFVRIHLQDDNVKNNLGQPIQWFSPTSGVFVDESAVDRSMVTNFDTNNGVAWRRIKHFCDYAIVE